MDFKPGDCVQISRINSNLKLPWPSDIGGTIGVIHAEVTAHFAFLEPPRRCFTVRGFSPDSDTIGAFYSDELSLYSLSPLEKVIYGV